MVVAAYLVRWISSAYTQRAEVVRVAEMVTDFALLQRHGARAWEMAVATVVAEV
jgi:hypothetical protein